MHSGAEQTPLSYFSRWHRHNNLYNHTVMHSGAEQAPITDRSTARYIGSKSVQSSGIMIVMTYFLKIIES